MMSAVIGNLPNAVVIHAGLEVLCVREAIRKACGSQLPTTLSSVSIGPFIEGAHSEDEKVSVSSVWGIYKVVAYMMENAS